MEGERLSAVVAGIELGAIGVEGATVVDVDLVAALGLPGALDGLGDLDVERLVERRGGAEEERER